MPRRRISFKLRKASPRKSVAVVNHEDWEIRDAIDTIQSEVAVLYLLKPETIAKAIDDFDSFLARQNNTLMEQRVSLQRDARCAIDKLDKEYESLLQEALPSERRFLRTALKIEQIGAHLRCELAFADRAATIEQTNLAELRTLVKNTLLVSTKIVGATQVAMLEIQQAARKQAKELNVRMEAIQSKLNAQAVLVAQFTTAKEGKRGGSGKAKATQTDMDPAKGGLTRSGGQELATGSVSRQSSVDSTRSRRSQKFEELLDDRRLPRRVQPGMERVYVRIAQESAEFCQAEVRQTVHGSPAAGPPPVTSCPLVGGQPWNASALPPYLPATMGSLRSAGEGVSPAGPMITYVAMPTLPISPGQYYPAA